MKSHFRPYITKTNYSIFTIYELIIPINKYRLLSYNIYNEQLIKLELKDYFQNNPSCHISDYDITKIIEDVSYLLETNTVKYLGIKCENEPAYPYREYHNYKPVIIHHLTFIFQIIDQELLLQLL